MKIIFLCFSFSNLFEFLCFLNALVSYKKHVFIFIIIFQFLSIFFIHNYVHAKNIKVYTKGNIIDDVCTERMISQIFKNKSENL